MSNEQLKNLLFELAYAYPNHTVQRMGSGHGRTDPSSRSLQKLLDEIESVGGVECLSTINETIQLGEGEEFDLQSIHEELLELAKNMGEEKQ